MMRMLIHCHSKPLTEKNNNFNSTVLTGSIYINSTAPGFDCGPLRKANVEGAYIDGNLTCQNEMSVAANPNSASRHAMSVPIGAVLAVAFAVWL